ncbi:hypothetical protein RFI_01880 [Reticulomyxa filosa]|uniref:Uncharacterized protein n=1 Tax=Reticulomyxa filosa TaxID=46433 RepID=X6PAL6_RETFI|nr:hypothetical protein RFI_01880 [Reticulomyxa filosa]|eukprot:ETO35196.1 hypothetical protein RFI_01880 [Reticulomyxa filosa]
MSMSAKCNWSKLLRQTEGNNIWALQENFSAIEKETVLQAWNCCGKDTSETIEVLRFINNNKLTIKFTIILQNQKHLLLLLEDFGNRVDKATILNIWKQCNQIYYETRFKLEEICSSRDTNRLKEKEELMIARSISLHILWNILRYPKMIKYRQISCHSLHTNLRLKCNRLCVDFVETLDDMEDNLRDFGFEKVNNKDWYYLQDIQILHLWKRYRKWISTQLVYLIIIIIFVCTKSNIPEKIFMLRNGKWKEYEIAFDYEYRRIVLFDNVKLKVKSLQVGNPKKFSLEFNVHIQWNNSLSDIDDTFLKRFCLILNHTWHFCTFDSEEREKLSDCCSVNAVKHKYLLF